MHAQSWLTLWDPMDYNPLGSSVHGIFQARILKWVAIPFSGETSWPKEQTHILYSVQFSCVQLFATPWTTACQPGFPVHHQLLRLAQTPVHWISDAIQPSHPLSSPSPPALNLAQHQGLFQWVNSSHHVAKLLELHLQHQSFQQIFRNDFLKDWLVSSPCSPRDSQESSPTPHFKSIHSSALSFLYGPSLTSIYNYWKNHSFD